jgi:hypothetical protein
MDKLLGLLLIPVFLLLPKAHGQDMDAELYQAVATKLNTYKTMKDFVSDSTGSDLLLKKETIDYIQQNGLLDETLPRIENGKSSIYFPVEKMDLSFNQASDEIYVTWKDQTLTIPRSMPLKNIVNSLERMNEKPKTTLFDLFISKAHAGVGVQLIKRMGVAIGITSTVITVEMKGFEMMRRNYEETVKKISAKCQKENSTVDANEVSQSDLTELLKDLKNWNKAYCLTFTGSTKEKAALSAQANTCRDLRASISCVERSLALTSTSNSSDRSSGKEVPAKKIYQNQKVKSTLGL